MSRSAVARLSAGRIGRTRVAALLAGVAVAAMLAATSPASAALAPLLLPAGFAGATFSFGTTGGSAAAPLASSFYLPNAGGTAAVNYSANTAVGSVSGEFRVESSGTYAGQFSHDTITTTQSEYTHNATTKYFPGTDNEAFDAIGYNETIPAGYNKDGKTNLNVTVSSDLMAIDITAIHASALTDVSIYLVLTEPLHYGANVINIADSYECYGAPLNSGTGSCVGGYDPHSTISNVLTDSETPTAGSYSFFALGDILFVPEPASVAVLGIGLLGLVAVRRRQRVA
jgi:hypothetical protein